MTRKDWYTVLGLLLLLWLLGGWVWRPVIEQALTKRAEKELAAMAGVKVEFRGQQAVLSGEVRWESERSRAEELVRNRIRASAPVSAGIGGGLNPVTDVVNEIEVRPLEPGWLVLLVDGLTAKLIGEVATEEEARDLEGAVSNTWMERGGAISAELGARLDLFDEAPVVNDTLASVPKPGVPGDLDLQFGLWAVRVGERWQRWSLNAVEDVIRRDGLAMGMTEEVWERVAGGAIRDLVAKKAAEGKRMAEVARIAALPLPHVVAAWSGDRLLLRGVLGSDKTKTAFLERVLEAFPKRRVLDDLRVSAERRPVSDFPPLKEPDESEAVVVLGIAGRDWQFGAANDEGSAFLGDEGLPDGMDLAIIESDIKVAVEWLEGGNAGIPSLPAPLQPAFLTLAVLHDRVLLAGQMAEEAHRAHLLKSVNQVYGSSRQIDADGLKVRGNCERTEAIFHTALGLPVPGDEPIIAVAKPGDSWVEVRLIPEMLRDRRLPQKVLPKGVPEALVTAGLAPAFDLLSNQVRLVEDSDP